MSGASSPLDGQEPGSQQYESVYLQECCFSIVCKDCLRLEPEAPKPLVSASLNETKVDEISEQPSKANQVKKMCLACLEPQQTYQELDCAKYSVLASLLAAINKEQPQQKNNPGQSSSESVPCQRCEVKEAKFYCRSACKVHLCEGCHQTIHSLGSFTEHEVAELAQQREPEISVPTLESLETCPVHGEKIEFYEEEESLD